MKTKSISHVDVAEIIASGKIGSYQALIIALLTALMLVEGVEMQTMSYAAPDLINTWHVSRTQLGPVFSASLLGYLVGALSMSPVSDRFGRRLVILFGTALFAVFTLSAAFSHTLTQLGICRFLAGLGLGTAIPAEIALCAEYVPRRLRATCIATLFFGYSVGAGLSGFGAAWVIERFGWPMIFVIAGVIPLILGIALVALLPESVRFLILKPGNGSEVARILQKLRPTELFDVSAGYSVPKEPILKKRISPLFSDGRATATLALWFALVAGLLGHYFLTSWLPTIFHDAGFSSSYGARVNSIFLMGGALGSLMIGPMLDRYGVASLGLLVLVAGPLVAALGLVVHTTLIVTAVAAFMAGTCVLGCQVGLSAVSGTIYPTSIRTTGTGWALGIGRLGSISGPIIGGLLIDRGLPHNLLFLMAAAPFVVSSLLIFALMLALHRANATQHVIAADSEPEPNGRRLSDLPAVHQAIDEWK